MGMFNVTVRLSNLAAPAAASNLCRNYCRATCRRYKENRRAEHFQVPLRITE